MKAFAHVRIERGVVHRFVFEWIPGDDTTLSNLIVALKGRGRENAWKFWSETFLRIHGENLPNLRGLHLLAAPAAAEATKDHSLSFASAFGSHLGEIPIARPLLKPPGVSFRRLGRAQREEQAFVKSTGRVSGKPRTFVLVDDVVTTGATARAVRQAVVKQTPFETWSLAGRTTSLVTPRPS